MDMGRAHRMIGEMYMLLEDFKSAIRHEELFLSKCFYISLRYSSIVHYLFSLEISRLEKNKVEEQRAYATIGRVHLLHGQSLPDLVQSTEPLKNAEKAFLKSLLICKKYFLIILLLIQIIP